MSDLKEKISKARLEQLYWGEQKTLAEIAAELGCGEQTLRSYFKRLRISTRSLSEARLNAIVRGKLPRHKAYSYDIHFFKAWTPGMAWVLGLLFTDGCLRARKHKDSESPPSYSVTLDQADRSLLDKVAALIGGSMPIDVTPQSYNKSRTIHRLRIDVQETVHDLRKLGLRERKSLTMTFPDVPPEYVRHFIRGCWDGDGGFTVSKERGTAAAHYTCGSFAFIERLRDELYNAGVFRHSLYRLRAAPGRTDDPAPRAAQRAINQENAHLCANYPKGRYPVRIYKAGNCAAYRIVLNTHDQLEALWHYFYDSVAVSALLERKKELANQALAVLQP